ncbi:hypothetical protein ACIOHC_36340 [Streptomyces sp. NPDC088252]|uniref:hypothetical protein n=1 Tax=Streptomyces sp. NPDC088252 TaxID=3365845 RepID=UPI0038224236
MVYIAGLEKLVQTSRSRRNMEKIQTAIEEVDEYREALEEWLETAGEVRDALANFEEKSGALDAALFGEGVQEKMLALTEAMQQFVPEPDSALVSLPENIETVKSELDELESMLEDREYAADERNSKWDEIIEALEGVVTGLDELSMLGVPLKSEGDH